ncbi:polynucleotide 5'-hydroxyl-kinase NOL9 [Epargyreus clarus]|uniref:polynucleotide 5'-hydroxyl-kinase NOL9 n=1 Tax=Epargyreus clarus TaxID=520877 RepID=UPI003C2B0C04
MEFFEQAHVAKGAETLKKEKKSEETVKKQLKQMLYGYKSSNNDIIKSSMDIQIDCDDSSSVSGFSDLNLTESSGADDTTRATIGSPEEIDSIFDELNIEGSPRIPDLPIDSDNEDSVSHQSLPDSSTSEDIQLEADVSSSQSDEELSLGASLKSLTDVETSQEFDPDGLLAAKIHERLRNKDESKAVPKRKLEKVDEENVIPQKVKSSNKSKKNKVSKSPQVVHPRFTKDDNIPSIHESLENSAISSPPYISINATEMPQEDFDTVLGDYKHSTIKNIPFDNENLIFSENDSSLYSTNIMTIDENDMAEEITDFTEEEAKSTIDVGITQGEMKDVIDLNSSQNDSIINIDDTMQSEISEELTKNNLEDSIKLIFNNNTCVCVMKHPAKMYIHGKFKVKALGGTVEMFGHVINEEPHEVYAPHCSFAQCLTTVEKDSAYYGLFSKLTSIGLSTAEAEDIVTTIGEHDGVLLLEPLRSIKMNFVEEYFSIANLFSKSSKHMDYCHMKAMERLGCAIYLNEPRKMFHVPIIWQELNKFCFKDQSRGIICGGKGVGKSTCVRYHVNKLVHHGPVLVIDLDIGQCEFTVAGNISATVVTDPLLGPNFTHLRKPERTLNLGMINPLDNMRRYVNAVVELITHCANDERLRDMRWIVNTMGLCNVVGLHFITIVILHCRPTYLLQIDSKNAKKRYDMFLRPQLVAAHYDYYKNMRLFANTTCPDNLEYDFILSHHTDSPVKNNNTLAPRDERYLNYLAYFSELLGINRGSTLLGITPYEVQLQDLCVYMNVKIPEGTVSQVLNGKIVALCQHEPGSVTKKTYVLADEPLLCHGHGLIRGIDFERGTLYVITPMPAEGLQMVDTLLYADWVPELRGQEAQLPAGIAVPYRMPTMHQQKQLMFTPRRRFNPVQLLKMSRGS